MATFLKKLIVFSSLLFFTLDHFATSAASFATDGQARGWLNNDIEARDRKLVVDSVFVIDNSEFNGVKIRKSERRTLRVLPTYVGPPSPQRAVEGNHHRH